MIKGTRPDFELLIQGEQVPGSDELGSFLAALGIRFVNEAGMISLAEDQLEWLRPGEILRVIKDSCPDTQADLIDLEIHRTIGSTNSHVMTRLNRPGNWIHVSIAEMQSAGRGRRGRFWVSPFGRNIYMTIGCFLKLPPDTLGGLSILTGMAVVDVLRRFGVKHVGLKWPNDVIMAGGKLAGVLVELKPAEVRDGESGGVASRGIGAVIGVGINLAMNAEEAGAIEQPFSQTSSQLAIPRNRFAGELAGEILSAIERFIAVGFTPFMELWSDYDCLIGREVKVLRGAETLMGIDRGVNRQGHLILETTSGQVVFHSGEVSLRTP